MKNLAFAGFTNSIIDTTGMKSIIGTDTVAGRNIIGIDTVANKNIIGIDTVVGKQAALIATARQQRQQIDALLNHIGGGTLSASDALIVDLTLIG
jgi:CRISPR/Cas system CMR-associated protein Cmr3 (group 5 of RAMP superfamily)